MPKMPKRPYPTWQRRHYAVLAWLLEHPGAKLKDCARATGYSASQVSRIVCSPDFSDIWHAMTAEACTAAYTGWLKGAPRQSP
jgi:hypothetical protein